MCLATIVLLTKQKFDSNYRSDLIKGKLTQIYYIVILLCLPLSMIWFTSSLDYRANLFPISLSVIALSLLVFILIVKIADLKNLSFLNNTFMKFARSNIFEISGNFNNQLFYYLSFIGFLLMNFIFGFPIAAALFINMFILFHNRKAYVSSICISTALMVILWALSSLLTLQFPNGLIGLFIDLPWWLGGQLN